MADQTNFEGRALFASVIESIPHGVIAWGADGRCRLVNDAAAGMLERSREDLLGCDLRSMPSLLDRSTDPEVADRFREALESGSSLVSATLVLTRLSSPLPVRADLTPLPGSELMLSLAVLPQAPSREAIFERTVLEFYEHTPDPVVVHRRGELLYANPATIKALGYESLEEIKGRPVIDLVHPDYRAAIVDRIRRMATEGEAVPIIEEQFLRKDGGVMTALVAALPLPYHGEQAITVIGHDLTELKRVEAEQARNQQRIEELADAARRHAAELAAVLDNMADTVIVCDTGRRVRVINKAARRLLGIGEDQEFDLDLHSLSEALGVRNSLGKPKELPMAAALRGEMIERTDVEVTSPGLGREIWLRVSAGPIRDSAGEIQAAVSVARDVTDLLELDRLKDQFIRVAAHELKTPVTIIKGYAHALAGLNGGIPKATRSSLDAIVRGADRIDRIVTDLVSISEVELGRLDLYRESVDLSRLVLESVDRASLLNEERNIRVTGADEIVAIVDPERFEQVLDRIINNALAYSPEGVDVEIEIRRLDSWAEISVRDRGVGIPEDKQAHIFERFYRAHTDTPYDYGGLGVGLNLSKAVVLAHGGKIWFESEEGVGSTFFIRVPLNPGTLPDV